MPSDRPALPVFAPAKINLYLHVTGRLESGYHMLDTLVAFADAGDTIVIEPSDAFDFSVNGPFAECLPAEEQDKNLVVRAALALAETVENPLNVRISLTKTLPVAAGIGGGSADAAATLRGLARWWSVPEDAPALMTIAATLGADVPVCLRSRTARLSGIGEIITPAPALPALAAVLVNPLLPCPTPEVFRTYREDNAPFKTQIPLPGPFNGLKDCLAFLKRQTNDLHAAAVKTVPQIETVLSALEYQDRCALARLSGSGATCFGLFETRESAKNAAQDLQKKYPDWWVQNTIIATPMASRTP